MGPMAQGMMGSRENEDRTSAGMWDTLELPAYSQQPKKIYHRDDDGNPIPPKKSVLDTEPEPEPEPESAGGDGDGDGLLQKGAAVIVSGLVSAAHHNGKSGRVLRYDRKKERYAVQLLNADGGDMDGERLLVKPSCLLEDLDAIDDEAAAAAEQQQQQQEPPPTPAEPEPMAPPVRARASAVQSSAVQCSLSLWWCVLVACAYCLTSHVCVCGACRHDAMPLWYDDDDTIRCSLWLVRRALAVARARLAIVTWLIMIVSSALQHSRMISMRTLWRLCIRCMSMVTWQRRKN